MEVRFKERYATQTEYARDVARSSWLYREEDFDAFAAKDNADTYSNLVVSASGKYSPTFSEADYDLLAGEDRASYLYNEFLQDRNETAVDEETGETYNVYERNKEYLNYRIEEAIDAKTFDSLSGFEKVIHTVGGTIGNALNELFLGTTEGLMGVLAGLSVLSPFGFIPGYADSVKDFIERDITGVQSNREALQRYARAYTYIDKNTVAKVVNDVTTGLTKMAPLLIPGAGQAIYFGSMAGSTSEEAIRANPDIDYGTLLLYTSAVTGLEFATEKISSKFFGGSAIDNLMFKASGNRVGSWIGKMGIDFLSEGFEEAIAEMGDSILYTIMVDNNAPVATISDILYAGLIGGLIGGVTAGGQIATTAKQVILEDGTVVSTKEAGDKGTKLSRTQSFRLNTAIEYASQLATKDAIQDLQVKYSNETLDDIKRNHSEEYAEAEEANNDRDKRLAEATLGLAKVYEMAGAQGFQRAAELANYTLNQKAELAKNYVAKSTAKSDAVRLVENEYARKHNGSSITIRESLTEREQQLSKAVRNAFGVNVYFGNLGSEDGNIRNNGLTLNEKTIILDDKLFNYKSVDEILNEIVKEELVHSLQFDSGVLTGKSLTELQMICSSLGIEGLDLKIKLDEAYAKDSPLTKIAEAQAKSLAQVLLFDEITVGKVFLQNKNIFKRTYEWLKGLRQNIENRKTKKDQKTKVEYNTVLTSLQMYRKAAASKIGNKEDAELMNKEILGNDANLDDLLNMMNVNYDTEHFSMVKINFGNTSTKVLEVNNLIRENSKQSWSFMINYEQALNSDFYNPEFVQKIQSRNPKRSFDYNLQDMLISDYGMCISSKDKCLMKVVDLTAATSEDFMMDLEDLYVDITSLEKYTSLSDIFSTKFKTQTLNSLGLNSLDSVKINIEYVDFKQSTPAQYIGGENKVITLKLPTKQELTPQEVNTIKHDLLHEVHHALADIQGLQTGTTAKTIRKALVNASSAEIDKLAKILLVDSFYQENKNNPNIILDYLSYGIYRITDGEYGAEAYEDSYVRGKEDKLKLKAGTTLNRTGFRKYTGYLGGMRATYFEGYGRFNGITLIPLGEESNIDTKLQSSNLLDASEVVAYNKEVTRFDSFGNYLNKLGDRKTLIDLGFNEEFIDSVSDIGASYSTITDAFNYNKIGNDNATNLVMKWLMEHKHGNVKNEADNKYIKTIQDIDKVRNYGLIYAQIYKAYMTKNNPEFSRTEPHTFEELQKFAIEGEKPLILKSESISNSITRLIEKPSNADNFNMAIMNMDYDYSAAKTGRLIGYMAKPKGLGNFIEESESFSHTKGTQSKEFSKLDIAAKGNVIDEAEKTAEDEYEDKESTQQAAEEDISETLEDVINQTEERLNELYDSTEYFALATRITRKTDKIYKTIRDAFGEANLEKIHKRLRALTKTKANFIDKIKVRINKINQNSELAKKHKDLLNRDYNDFTPKQFDDYIAKLDKILETKPAEKATSIWEVSPEEKAKLEKESEQEPEKKKDSAIIDVDDIVVVTKGRKYPIGTEFKVTEKYNFGYQYGGRVTVGYVPYLKGRTADGKFIKIELSNVTKKSKMSAEELSKLQKSLPKTETKPIEVKIDEKLSTSQKEYFKDSKIRDEQGNLLTLYHGSPVKSLDTFNFETDRPSNFFTTNKQYAEEYINDIDSGEPTGEVYEVYLNITNPFDVLEHKNDALTEKILGKVPKTRNVADTDKIYAYLKTHKTKFDGIIAGEELSSKVISEYGEDANISYVPLNADQIKLVNNKNPQQTDSISDTKKEKPVEVKKEEVSVPPEAADIKIAIDNAETLMKDDSAASIANCILNAFSAAKHGESEAQFFEGTDLDYEKLSFNLVDDHLPLFSMINDDNYSDIRTILTKDTSENGKLSLLMFDWYCLKMEGKFSPETRALIRKTNRVELTKAAQRMAAQAKRVMEKKGVTTMVSSFKENGINTQVTDEILAKAFPELANKNKRIAELEKQIKELDEKIKNLKDDNAAITEAFLQQKKLAEEKVILAKGTNEDIADYKLNQMEESGVEGIENASKKAKQILQEMIDIATVADESGKQVGFYIIDEKTGEPKPFPNVQEKILKVAKAMKGFRMWAMLSSPVTYVRNWSGNVGMKVLEKSSAALSRSFEKEITDEQYNALENRKTETKKKLKELSKEAEPIKAKLVSKEAVLENTDKDSEEYKKLESEIKEINKELNPLQEKIDAAEKEIRGYEFRQHQYNIHKVKATEETKNYVKNNFGTTIDNLITGNKYSVDKDTLTQKAISTKEASLKIKAKKGTFKEKVISWAQLYEMKGLETGWTGDRNFIRTSLINNFSDILESNRNLFLREIKTESEKLHKIKKPSETQIARMELLDKALTTQKMEDIVATRDVTEINMLLDKADALTKKQYFKNSNVLSEWMYNLGKKHPVAATLVSFVMPFPKVAYNVLTTAIEYSPLAWFKALTKKSVISQMEKGEYLKSTGFEKADYASIKAKATVGTVMFIAGTLATLLGFIDIDDDDYLGAALTFNFGDSQFKIGLANMAPSLTTFSTAAAVMWAFKEHRGLKGAINQALSTLYDNTLLGNVENIFRYGSLENWASNTSISWMSQYVPAVLKLITKVTSGGVKKDKSGTYLQKVSRTLASYIPGLNTLVPNKIDPYTGKLTYTAGSDSWLFNFIAGVSPLDIKLNNLTGLEAEAKSVNAITTGFNGNITINGKDITISNKEPYAKYRAEYINTHAKDIISGKEKVTVEDDNGNRITTTYGNLNDKQKANVLNRVYSDATSKTKIKYWLDEGNYYYTSNKEEYNELRKLFKNNKIIYRSSWKTSKFVKG